MSDSDQKHDRSDVSSNLPTEQLNLLRYLAQPGQSCTDDDGRPLIELEAPQEARLRRKIDLYVIPPISIIYLLCFLDRVNIGNARIAGLEKDLGMQNYDFNILMMATYVPYTVCEPLLTLLVKRLNPGRAIPIFTICFGLTTLTFAFVSDLRGAVVNRVFLGIAESAMVPGVGYYLSRWYRRTELTVRIAVVYSCGALAGALGGLLASAILDRKAIGSLHGWKMIFFIEGLITVIVGILAYVMMTDRIESARWLAEDEKALALVRIKSERVASLGVVDSMRSSLTRQGMKLPHAYMLGVSSAIALITASSAAFMMPTLIKTLFDVKSVPQQQILSTPPYLVACVCCILVAFISTKTKRIGIFILANKVLSILGFSLLVGTHQQHSHTRYAALFLIIASAAIGAPLSHSCLLANCNSDSERAGATAVSALFTHSACILAAWYYLPYDAPAYKHANVASLALWCFALVLMAVMLLNFRRENRLCDEDPIDERTAKLTPVEKELLGNRHPAFRYIY